MPRGIAHADYCLRFAGAAATALRGTEQLEAVRRARHENANTHAAIQWLIARARAGDATALENGLLLCGYLNWFWHIGGQHLTARVHVDALLELARNAPSSRGRALARLAAGMISTATGEFERSLGEWAGGYEDAKAVGDAEAAAEGLMGVGYCCLSLGRMDACRAALDESIERSAGGVSDFVMALSMSLKGMLLFVTGDLAAGSALVEEARRIQERLNDREGGGLALSILAQMAFAKGDHARALVLYGDALESLATIGDQPEVARVQCEIGWTALASGDTACGAARLSPRRRGERAGGQRTRLRHGAARTRRGRSRGRPLRARRRHRRGGAGVERTRRHRHRAPDGPRCREPHRCAQSVDPPGQAGRYRGERERVVAGGGIGDGQLRMRSTSKSLLKKE